VVLVDLPACRQRFERFTHARPAIGAVSSDRLAKLSGSVSNTRSSCGDPSHGQPTKQPTLLAGKLRTPIHNKLPFSFSNGVVR
jgi:hypothetical protein